MHDALKIHTYQDNTRKFYEMHSIDTVLAFFRNAIGTKQVDQEYRCLEAE